jgi:hypothetical protein
MRTRRASVARHGTHRGLDDIAPQQFSVEAVEPVARRSLGFAVERTLQLLDFRGRRYPVEKRFRFRPAIIPSLAVSAGTPTTAAAFADSVGLPPCTADCVTDASLEFSRLTLSAHPVLSPSLTPPRSCAAA